MTSAAAIADDTGSRRVADRTANSLSEQSTFAKCIAYLTQISAFDLSSILVLLTAVLTGPSQWYIAAPVCAMAVAAVVIPPLRHSKRLWLVLTCLIAGYDVVHWYEADNHKYLLAYTMLAVWISLHVEDTSELLARASRLLIGSTFACALAWKLATQDFANGEFFVWSMLFDERFVAVAQRLAGIDPAMHETNLKSLGAVMNWEGLHSREALRSTTGLLTVTRLMAGWTLLIEALVTAAYLVPARSQIARLASPLLMVFVVTTYAIAPVLGFGYLLLALGVAAEARPALRFAYVAVFLVLRMHTVPWSSLAERATGLLS